MSVSATESFTLSLHGGAVERQYRRACPGLLALPWSSLDPALYGANEVTQARAGWCCAAQNEHDSAHFYAELAAAMIAQRLPLDLTAVAARFQLEELAHAELCGRVAVALGGGAPIAVRTLSPRAGSRDPLLALAHQALWAVAIGETHSHAMLKEAWRRAQHPLLRAVRGRLAKDEASHGIFGWRLLEWLLPELDDRAIAGLQRTAAQTLEGLRTRAERIGAMDRTQLGELSALGAFEPGEYRNLSLKVVERRIRPRLQRLGLSPSVA